MINATIWSVYQHKVVDSLDPDNTDEKELKTRLLLELKKNPNPNQKDCDEFIRIIREHEAVVNSRGYKEDGRNNTVKTVKKDEGPKVYPPRPPHALCGLVHGKRECKYKCSECGKPHSEKDCYVLYPSKAPKGWRTPEKRRQGRDREREKRDRRNPRSQTRSGERRRNRSNDRRGEPSKYEKRDKSPQSSRDRIQKVDKRDRKSETEDDSDQERKDLERRLEKLKEKKNSRTNRVRREMFEDEDSYINLQKDWNNTRSSRDRNIRIVKKSDPCSPLTQRAAGVSPRQSFGSGGHRNISPLRTNQVKEAIGSLRSKCDLNEGEEEYVDLSEGKMVEYGDFRVNRSGKKEYVDLSEGEMVGEGDFRGIYPTDPNSRYNELIKRIKKKNRDPTLKGKFLNKCRGKWYKFCCDTGSSCAYGCT